MYWFLKQRFLMHPEAGAATTGGVATGGTEEAGAQDGAGGEGANNATGAAGADDAASPAEGEARAGKPPEGATFTPEQEAMIESLLDKRTHKLGNEVKELRGQLAAKKQKLAERMTDDEIRQMELDEKEAKLAEREAELATEHCKRFATEAIVAAVSYAGIKRGYPGNPNGDYKINRDTVAPSLLAQVLHITDKADNAVFDEKLADYAEAFCRGICGVLGGEYSQPVAQVVPAKKAGK